jgi:superfamily II DNA or RNA helicase
MEYQKDEGLPETITKIRHDLDLNRGYKVNPNAHSKGKWNSNFKLFEWQKQLAAMIHDNEDVIVTAVTSTGKTFISVMLAAFSAISSGEDKVLILTPSNATLEETYYNIKSWHKSQTNIVDAMYVIEEEDQMGEPVTRLVRTWQKMPKTQLIIATFEAIIQDGPSGDLVKWCKTPHNEDQDFNLTVIIDEAHIPQAHTALKSLLAKKIPITNYLILSATLSPSDMAFYGKLSDDFKVVDSKVRPVPLQLFAAYQTAEAKAKRQQKGTVKYSKFAAEPRLAIGELYSGTDLTPSDYQRLGLPLPQSREKQYSNASQIYKQKKEKISASNQSITQRAVTKLSEPVNLYGLMQTLMRSTPRKVPALLIHNNFTDMRTTVTALTSYIEDLIASDANYQRLSSSEGKIKKPKKPNQKDLQEEERMGMAPDATAETIRHQYYPNSFQIEMPDGIPLKDWIREAAEVHVYVYSENREVPTWYRNMVLDAYKNRSISFLVADSSLATGVNLPAATVVVLDRRDETSDSFYMQAVGRAGRYGIEAAGYANVNLAQDPDEPVPITLFKKKDTVPSRGITVTKYIPSDDEDEDEDEEN